MTLAVMISPLISMFTPRAAAAARARREWTNPSEGRMPDSDSKLPAHRSTGTWWMTMRKTARARVFRPQVTVPGSPDAAGGAAPWTRPQAQATAWLSSYWVTDAAAAFGGGLSHPPTGLPASARYRS
jgi:hypothetical protein